MSFNLYWEYADSKILNSKGFGMSHLATWNSQGYDHLLQQGLPVRSFEIDGMNGFPCFNHKVPKGTQKFGAHGLPQFDEV